jgi:hypothetical protein
MSLQLANAARRQPTQLAASQLLALVAMDDEQQVAVLLADMRALVVHAVAGPRRHSSVEV